jgi:hypothetical protein
MRRAPVPGAPAAAAAAAAFAATLSRLPFPPHPPLAGSEPGSFAEGTIKTRLPAIMDTVLADLDRLLTTPPFAASPDAQRQVAAAAAAVRTMQAEMPTDAVITPLAAPAGAAAHLVAILDWTNAAVEAWQQRGKEVGARKGGLACLKAYGFGAQEARFIEAGAPRKHLPARRGRQEGAARRGQAPCPGDLPTAHLPVAAPARPPCRCAARLHRGLARAALARR